MKLINKIKGNCESGAVEKIVDLLPNLDITMVARVWNDEDYEVDGYYFTYITSCEAHNYIPTKELLDPNCLACFIHYYPKIDAWNSPVLPIIPKLYPIQLGTCDYNPENIKPYSEREYDVCFLGQYDPYTRKEFRNVLLSDKWNEYGIKTKFMFYDGWNKGLSSKDYAEIMCNSKIALVPHGSASLDTFRFYEAMQSGCIVISNLQNRYWFMTGSPHFEVHKPELFPTVCRPILDNNELGEILSKRSLNFWNNCLSPEVSASFISDVLMGGK